MGAWRSPKSRKLMKERDTKNARGLIRSTSKRWLCDLGEVTRKGAMILNSLRKCADTLATASPDCVKLILNFANVIPKENQRITRKTGRFVSRTTAGMAKLSAAGEDAESAISMLWNSIISTMMGNSIESSFERNTDMISIRTLGRLPINFLRSFKRSAELTIVRNIEPCVTT